jgi:predicted extracellular nuclease
VIAGSLLSVRRMTVASLTLVLAVGFLPSPRSAQAVATELFFSEYVEGSSNNKALEIFNGTGAAIDLATGGYAVDIYFNGAGAAGTTIQLSGTLATGDAFVLADDDADTAILGVADQTSFANFFNGDDVVVLREGTTIVDVIGQIGFDPGAEWGVERVSTADNTLRRKAGIDAGDTNGADAFDPAIEWDGFPSNTFSGLGSHGGPTPPTGIGAANPSSLLAGASTLLTVAVTPGTNPGGITVTANLAPIGGAESQAFFDDGTNGDTTAGDLTFTYSATVAAATPPGDKAIRATVADADGRTSEATIALTVTSPEPTEIWQIQGAGHVSPLSGQAVFGVEGTVTAVGGSGFWMTDPTPDADEATSNGIFVFRGGGTKPAVGDAVRVNGRVVEFRPGGGGGFENLALTEITTPNSFVVVSRENPLHVTVVGAGGRMPPTQVIDDDTLATGAGGDGTIDGPGAVTTFDPASDGLDFYESLEGMYIQVNDALAVGPRNNFGEIAVVGDGGAHAGPRTPRGGVLAQAGDFNPERIILDDALFPQPAGRPPVTPAADVGDEFAAAIRGVLDYSFGNFKLLFTEVPETLGNGLEREATVPQGPHDLAVATFNVENLSPADIGVKVNGLAAQVVHNLRAPDLIAIEEMQDNSGFTDNGVVAADQSWQTLINAIVAAGGPTYEYRQIDPQNNADGGAPGGNIRVGFLFRTDRGLEFVDRPGGDATSDTDVAPTANGKGARLTISPGRVLPSPEGPFANAFFDTRKSLAGEFRWRGETLFAVVNHFSSKGDDNPLFGRFQPPVRSTEFEGPAAAEDGWRHGQAQVINDFVDEIRTVDPNANVIVLGDINDFDFSETVDILTGLAAPVLGVSPETDGSGATAATGRPAVLATLFDTLPADERYSYVFEGNSQVLDQILVSPNLLARNPTYDVVHVNAEFADQASDHDPSVVRIAFQPRSEAPSEGAVARVRGGAVR